jgi:hypothetical protein
VRASASAFFDQPNTSIRVRAKIRANEEGFETGPFARALYKRYEGDPEDVEKGYLRSQLLLKVCWLYV